MTILFKTYDFGLRFWVAFGAFCWLVGCLAGWDDAGIDGRLARRLLARVTGSWLRWLATDLVGWLASLTGSLAEWLAIFRKLSNIPNAYCK